NNAILALLDNPGSTLLGVQRILVDKEYRKQILSHVKDPIVLAFWTQEYEQYDPRFRNEAIAPIQNKVGQFLSSSLIRNIVGQPSSTLNLYDAMNQEKLILVNVSKGRIGEDNSQLLGAMVITKLQLAAMERVRIAEEERKDFYLYVDEFQNFATDSFASILSEARKYRLNLVIAHQYVGQLVTDTSTRVRDAVFGNVGTLVVFRVGAGDAEFLEKEFTPEVTIEDLVGLPNYNIYLKLMIDQVRSRPFSANTLPPLAVEVSADAMKHIIDASRSTYARKRVDVEDEMNRWSGFGSTPVVAAPRIAEKRPETVPHNRDRRVVPPNDNKSFVRSAPINSPTSKPPFISAARPQSILEGRGIKPIEHQKESLPVLKPPPAVPVTPPAPKPISLSTLRSSNSQEESPALRRHRPVEKKSPGSVAELRSVLKGVLAKRDQAKAVPKSDSWQAGERVKL
ncbi:MAG: hypothetical protein G01um101466_850, partial [Parcubacteria group bacterium Gr01-1014_66]